MAILKSSEGVRINALNSTQSGWGCLYHQSTRTWAAYQSGINMFQITQSGALSYKQTLSLSLRWACFRTSGSTTEMPALFATARLGLNTGGVISMDYYDWQSWGGNGILWPYVSMGGNSVFIGANNGGSTGIVGSVHITMCTLYWNNVVVTAFSD